MTVDIHLWVVGHSAIWYCRGRCDRCDRYDHCGSRAAADDSCLLPEDIGVYMPWQIRLFGRRFSNLVVAGLLDEWGVIAG
jgi:hypothetical protein